MISRRNPSSVWQQSGLVRSRRRAGGRLLAGSVLSRATAFREGCVELGGYFQAFAVFLSGRADLLPNPYLDELAKVEIPYLGGEIDPGPPAGAEELPHFLFARAFRLDRGMKGAVIVEVAPPDAGIDIAAWKDFESGLEVLEGFPEQRILAGDVRRHFRRWLEIHADLGRKRRMLEHLGEAPEGCITRIPELVPELCGPLRLAYSCTEGRTPAESVEDAGEGPSDRWVESSVEQLLILSSIAAHPVYEEIRLTGNGGAGYRVWPFLESVPIQHYQSLLQYVASSIAEDTGRAMRMLVRMTRNEDVVVPESEIWRELSGLRFEMDREGRFPESVEKLVDFWKAVSGTGAQVPLFFHLFQRQLVLLGPRMISNEMDRFVVGVATVLSRLVNFRVLQNLNMEKAREWAVGGGLLMMGMIRQMGALVEQLRDNDLSVSVATTSQRTAPSNSRGSLAGALLLVLLLLTLQGSLLAPEGSLGVVLAALSALSGVALVVSVVRGR